MRRAVLTLGGTVAGLAALFSFKTHVPGVTPVAEPSTPTGLSVSAPPRTTSPTAMASPSASASASRTTKPTAPATTPTTTAPTTPAAPATTQTRTTPTTTAPRSTAPSKKPTPTPTPSATKSSAPSGTFTGSNESTNFGPVQVQITVSAGKITAANDVQQPSDSIASNAVSQLNSETLQAQSANIQAVSGATYTSDGYISSLQQAVDQAGL